MFSEEDFLRYVAAFNLGDTLVYGSFYAPSIIFQNGAGARLQSAKAIIDYYEAFKGRIARKMEVRAVIVSEKALCAALHSRFEIRSETEEFSGETLGRGDVVLLESMAMYELEGDRFASIQARSISRQIVRVEAPR